MKRLSPTVVEIDTEALRFNFRQLKKKLARGVRALCVVKTDAYGHGGRKAARILQEEGADFFGVGTVDEAVDLREGGVTRPILALMGIIQSPSDDRWGGSFEALHRYQITPVIYEVETAERLNAFLSSSKKKLPYHLKVDTGMTRLGILAKDVESFCGRTGTLSHLQPSGIMTHLADAGNSIFTGLQTRLFAEAADVFCQKFPREILCHFANSQAVIDNRMNPPSSHLKSSGAAWMSRFGIALYGSYPLERDRRLIDLKPVLSWKTKIVAVKKIAAKTAVSYGRTFKAARETLVGILPVGYADGYPRLLSNRSEVLVKGKRAPVIGTICMDMMMVDLTSSPAKAGDDVVLIGKQGTERIAVEEIADLNKTISYEIFTGISARVSRVYT